jgi:spermidine synthase
VDCVELDPLVVETGRRFLPENTADPRIHMIMTDGRRFIRQTTNRYEVVILALPDPSTAQLNRFFTVEFFGEVSRALMHDGVLALAVGRYENYVSPELARLLATAHRTLRGAFTNVVMLPGGRVFFLASDGPLGVDIADRLERAGIQTRFVNRHYLDAMLTPDRLGDLEHAATVAAPVNRDFNPVLYFYHLRHWASQFNWRVGVVEIALGLAMLVYVARLRGAQAVVFAGGFASSSLEVVLLLGFQAMCGSLYHQLGIIVTVFMAGLALGAAWANRICSEPGKGGGGCPHPADPARSESAPYHGQARRLSHLALALAGLGLLLPLALASLSRASALHGSTLVVQAAIALLTLVLAALVGAEFPLACRIESGSATRAASRVYTADFLGACLGALLASAWLIPALGVTGFCLLTAALNMLASCALFWRMTSA